MTDEPSTKSVPAQALLVPPVLASLTLGLAPFAPEPHIVGKLRWIGGGAVGMGVMDWFDALFHGAPWLWLFGTVIYLGVRKARGA